MWLEKWYISELVTWNSEIGWKISHLHEYYRRCMFQWMSGWNMHAQNAWIRCRPHHLTHTQICAKIFQHKTCQFPYRIINVGAACVSSANFHVKGSSVHVHSFGVAQFGNTSKSTTARKQTTAALLVYTNLPDYDIDIESIWVYSVSW